MHGLTPDSMYLLENPNFGTIPLLLTNNLVKDDSWVYRILEAILHSYLHHPMHAPKHWFTARVQNVEGSMIVLYVAVESSPAKKITLLSTESNILYNNILPKSIYNTSLHVSRWYWWHDCHFFHLFRLSLHKLRRKGREELQEQKDEVCLRFSALFPSDCSLRSWQTTAHNTVVG